MIDPFEAALADLLADRVGSHPAVQAVSRPGAGGPAPVDDAARVVVSVVDAHTGGGLGIDRDERLDEGERPTQRLGGRVRIALTIAAGDGRAVLWRAADAVLVALHDPRVRTGAVWGDDHEQGFAIDRFRLAHVSEPAPPAVADGLRLEIWCDYSGRFWPVEPIVEGDVILAPVRTRIAVLDADLPASLTVASGSPDLAVPVTLDLRVLGADPRLVARLMGAAPPGELVGDDAGVPAGSVGYPPDDDGRFTVVFRPAGALTAASTARVVLSLAAVDRPTVRIGEVQIRVQP